MERTKGRINELKDKMMKNSQSEKWRESRLKKQSFSDLQYYNNNKTSNVPVIGVSEGKEKEDRLKCSTVENLPNLEKNL